MEAILHKLQADIASRKQPRRDMSLLLRGGVMFILAVGFAYETGVRSVDPSAGAISRMENRTRFGALHARIDAQEGELELMRVQNERLLRAVERSTLYGIPADLALTIEEVALAEGVSPELAFEVVRVESRFNPSAVSSAGALGLTQLMPATADMLAPGISRAEIFDRETNLRLGFRFLGYLVSYYEGDVRLALQAYNRGPTTVDRLLSQGRDPGRAYSDLVLERR
jgi:soluble lytic murein transglycosylase-like protein